MAENMTPGTDGAPGSTGGGTRGAGRPASIDPDRIADVALALFADQGYENTSMEDIARAAGIGRKSLYRYFSSKSALVWGGTESVQEVIAGGLRSVAVPAEPDRNALSEAERRERVLRAVIGAIGVLPSLSVTRGRLRLINSYDELAAEAHRYLGQERDVMARYLQETGVPARRAALAAAALGAALVAAWTQWAESNDPDPRPYLAGAVDVVRLGD